MSQSQFSLPESTGNTVISAANQPEAGRIAAMIDHALLRPDLVTDDVLAGCMLAARYAVASVCVRPADVALAATQLSGSHSRGVKVGTVVGFPHGSSTTSTKVAETLTAVADGAHEIDMVINIGRLVGGDDQFVEADINAVVEATGDQAPVKVILENAYLGHDEIVRACRLAEAAGASYVKTSTGFAPGGATVEAVRLMRANVSPSVGVKAAGGIRDLRTAIAMIEAGATRLGTTATAAILDEAIRTR